MAEETANTTVEEQADGSVSSTEEQALEDMSREELAEALLKEKEAKEKAVKHMREQERKRKTEQQTAQTGTSTDEDSDEEVSKEAREIIRDEARKLLREEQTQAQIEKYNKSSETWLKEQSWASDLFEDSESADELYVKFSGEVKRLAGTELVDNEEQYKQLMRLAAVNVTKRPDALMQESAEHDIASDKSQSATYRGSAARPNPSNFSGFSQREQEMIERVNAQRTARGEKPLKPEDIMNQ